ncbi:hypothetical protein ACFX13_007071 [Malus domestica]
MGGGFFSATNVEDEVFGDRASLVRNLTHIWLPYLPSSSSNETSPSSNEEAVGGLSSGDRCLGAMEEAVDGSFPLNFF